jgi:hypothetical protein
MKRDKTDSLFSRYVRMLCDFTCKRCGKKHAPNSQGLHCAHWRSRGKWTTRFERDNATALCRGCHSYLDNNPSERDEFFYKILGTKRALEIITLSNKTLKDIGLTKESLKKQVDADLKNKLRRLEG